MVRLAHENDPEILRQAALLLDAENERLIQKNIALTKQLLAYQGITDPDALQLRLKLLEEELAKARQKIFGASTERRPGDDDKPREETKKPQTGHGPRPQPQLPIIPVLHTLDEADKACPQCGGELTPMAGQFEESEEVDVVERTFVLKRHQRQKYRCSCNACVETALGPPKLFAGARYSIEFAIAVAVAKYADHLPLERQVKMMARDGLVVDSQTLWDCIEALARHLESAHKALAVYLLAKAVLGADETRWRLMGKKGEDAGEADWQVWLLAGDDAVYYQIEDSRSTEAAKRVLGDYAGILMVDGYRAYQTLQKRGGKMVLAYCWSHCRRKYVQVEKFYPDHCAMAIGLIRELYAVEDLCPKGPEGDALRRQLRDERSRPIVARIQEWAIATRQRLLPRSGLAGAIDYMLKLWPGLVRFLDDPRIPLDNNHSERGMRGPVVGRKNHYGSRSKRGTEVAALFYSLIESAKLAGRDPREYLRQAVHAALRGERIALPHEVQKPP